MTTAATSYPRIGTQAVGNFNIPDNVQRMPLGDVIAVDDPNWGGQELIYLAIPAATPLKVGECVVWDTDLSIVAVPNTANQGAPVAFSLNAVPTSTDVQYSWFVISGQTLAWSSASVAASAAIGVVAAGQLGAVAAGKQVLGARVVAPATATLVKPNVQTLNGTPKLRFTTGTTEGVFVGQAVTGTGIPASTTILQVNPDNSAVMSNNATATGSVSATLTNTAGTDFWNTLNVDRPHLQGQIT